jgi:hypothetical protein
VLWGLRVGGGCWVRWGREKSCTGGVGSPRGTGEPYLCAGVGAGTFADVVAGVGLDVSGAWVIASELAVVPAACASAFVSASEVGLAAVVSAAAVDAGPRE